MVRSASAAGMLPLGAEKLFTRRAATPGEAITPGPASRGPRRRRPMCLEVRDSPIHGKGVFTTESIRKHSAISKVNIVREITDEKPLDPDNGELLHHCHWYPDGTMVLVGEPHRYLNHSCAPNTFVYSVNRAYYLLAMRDIRENEELTLEYSLTFVEGETWDCRCGSPSCRGRYRMGFRYMSDSQKMEFLPYLDPWFAQVHADLIETVIRRQLASAEGP
jgi:hypothetical protein